VVKAAKKVFDWVGDAISKAKSFITRQWNAFKKTMVSVGHAIASAGCSIAEAFLTSVVANVVKYVLKATSYIVYEGGKFISKALKWVTNGFWVDKAVYSGSIKEMLKLNFGSLELDVKFKGDLYRFTVHFDLKEWGKMLWSFAKKLWRLLYPEDKPMPAKVDDNSEVFQSKCMIQMPTCRRDWNRVGTFTDTQNARTRASPSACKVRAREWHDWCQNTNQDQTVVVYSAQGGAAKIVNFWPPQCTLTVSTCFTKKKSTGQHKIFGAWDVEACFRKSVDFYEECGNRANEWINADFHTGSSRTSRKFGCSNDRANC
jgi:hypothetical protein